MSAIFKREFRNFFTSPIGYVFIAVILFFEGFEFYSVLQYQATETFNLIYSSIFTYCMMLIPILTMRLMSEDKKQKTDQALLTAPVSLPGLVMGKFLAAFSVYGIAICATLIHALVMSFFGAPNWGSIFGNILGSLLYGGAMISIGLFLSGLTDSQIIAAISTFGVSIFLMLVSLLGQDSSTVLGRVTGWLSFNSRYTNFANGIFDFASTIFFLSITAVFLFLSVGSLEKRRWS